MAADFDLANLFDSNVGDDSNTKDGGKKPRTGRRGYVSQWDHIAVQGACLCIIRCMCVFFFLGMNPTGESQLANIPLNKLWDLCVQGNKVVQFHSNLAAEDSMRQGIGLSQAAEALLNAFEKMRSPQIKAIIREDLFEKV